MKKYALLTTFTIITSLFLFGNDQAPKQSSPAADASEGGRLYDKWYNVKKGTPKPKTIHPLYPTAGKVKNKPANTWRCKECHGWDYKGQEGAYSKGRHFTGIKGLLQLKGKTAKEVQEKFNSKHPEFKSLLSDEDKRKISVFLSKGIIDMQKQIDSATKKIKEGNATKGQAYYQTLCSQCHGKTGNEFKKMPDLRALSLKNPWESLHKILHGQPGKKMPALNALDKQVATGILKYLQAK